MIRGGTVVDGSGGDPFVADVGISGGRIETVASHAGHGRQEIDADGLVVTPGFVDIHTHYDGQVTWEDRLAPSSAHGVTTVVTGNCGVGFAPCRPDDRDGLIELTAGVEDIPEVVMGEGLHWDWQGFPSYLDAIDRRHHDIDVATMIPHSALRVFAMGERALLREPATGEDIAVMATLTAEAIRAGALGCGTSRAVQHRSLSGAPIPTLQAAEDELRGIAMAIAGAGSGVLQLNSSFTLSEDVHSDFAIFRRIADESGVPLYYSLTQKNDRPEQWRDILTMTGEAVAQGVPIRAQVFGRPTGLLLGHQLTKSPFSESATYRATSTLPLEERMRHLRDPQTRETILAESTSADPEVWKLRFEMSDPPEYEPKAEDSIFARARRSGVTPESLAYDLLLADDGKHLLIHAIQNYSYGSLDASFDMLTDENTIMGLGDGGAHLGLLCDASYTTSMLAYWTRDRRSGPRLGLPETVRAMTADPAEAFGLGDRGRIEPGFKADVNVIDYDRLQLRMPEVVHDLPAGGRRVIQKADGYVATVVSGSVTYREGEATGSLPGRLVRGSRMQPAGVR